MPPPNRQSFAAAAPAAAAPPLALVLACVAAAGPALPARAVEAAVQVVDTAGKPMADAVVAVYVKGSRSTAAPGTVTDLGQRDRQFVPQVQVIQTGTALNFPNFDTVRHHVYSFSATRRFELKLYIGTPAAPVVFDKPGVATLGCNIHDRMAAWVVVVDTPHFAKTDATGTARLDLPAGTHRAALWHVGLGESAPWIEQTLTLGAETARVRWTAAPAP